MTKLSLGEFTDGVLAKGRIGKDDVRMLQRGVLPDGIACREEAEALLTLDRAAGFVHPSWTVFLVAAVVDFVVWGARPTGYVDKETALWLAEAIVGEGGPTHRGERIAAEIRREAQGCDEGLAALAPAGACKAERLAA